MTAAVALAHLVIGVAFTSYGVITALEMRRDWRSFGFSHFGAAWIAMAFTCGPHHLVHGIHVGLEGRAGGPLDLFAAVVGLPVALVWLALRIEAFRGGRGDRFILGQPGWLRAVPTLALVYLGAVTAASVSLATAGALTSAASIVSNVLLVGVYMNIGWFIVRTQLRNHPLIGGWSVSGLCLSAIFPTCALMHGVWAAYALAGTYHHDIHGGLIDWLSVPAAVYFLWVVRRLYRDSLRDWNHGPDEVARPQLGGFTGADPMPPPLGGSTGAEPVPLGR